MLPAVYAPPFSSSNIVYGITRTMLWNDLSQHKHRNKTGVNNIKEGSCKNFHAFSILLIKSFYLYSIDKNYFILSDRKIKTIVCDQVHQSENILRDRSDNNPLPQFL